VVATEALVVAAAVASMEAAAASTAAAATTTTKLDYNLPSFICAPFCVDRVELQTDLVFPTSLPRMDFLSSVRYFCYSRFFFYRNF